MTVDLQFRADVRQAVSNTAKLTKQVVRLEERLKRMGSTSRKTSKSQQTFGSAATRSIKQLGASYLGLTAIIRGVGAVMTDIADKSEKAKGTILGLAQAESNFLINTSALSKKATAELTKGIELLASQQGIERRVLFPAAGAGVSGSGGLPIPQVLEGLAIGAKLASAGEDIVKEIVGAAFDIKRAVPSLSVREASGIVAQTGQLARIEELGKTGRGMARSLTTLVQLGFTVKEAQALFITGTQASADKEGRRTATAIINWGTKLAKAFKGRPEKTFTERLRFLEANPAAQRQFADLIGDSLWAQLRLPMKNLVKEGTNTNKAFKRNIAAIENSGATKQGREDSLQRLLNKFKTSESQRSARLDRTLKAAVEEVTLAGGAQARLGSVRTEVDNILQQVKPSLTGLAFRTIVSGISKIDSAIDKPADINAFRLLREAFQATRQAGKPTKGILSALRQQAAEISPAELATQHPAGQQTLRRFAESIGARFGGAGAINPVPDLKDGGAATDVEKLLNLGNAINNRMTPVMPGRDMEMFIKTMETMKRFAETQISQQEFNAASAQQRRDIINELKGIEAALRTRVNVPFNRNANIEDKN